MASQILVSDLLAPLPLGQEETHRVMSVCNACRYCEAMCPVFSQLANYRVPSPADLDYLANLCHNCGACFDVCQYAQPHPFALNVPAALAEQRLATYEDAAWPRGFASSLRSQPKVVVSVLLGLLTLVLAGFALLPGSSSLWVSGGLQGDFYAVMPHWLMASLGGATFGFAALSLCVSLVRFTRRLQLGTNVLLDWHAWREALPAAITLRYMGDSQGCETSSGSLPGERRLWHHFMAGGFALCFASTCVATVYHYGLGMLAPYAWSSLPVVLGLLGGLGLLVGPLALIRLHFTSSVAQELAQRQLSQCFLGMLAWVSGTGLLLLVLRDHASMPLVLAVHLGAVFTLFVLLPYSKFVHAPFRVLSLLKLAADSSANQ